MERPTPTADFASPRSHHDGAVPGEHPVAIDKFSTDGKVVLEAGKDEGAAIEQAMQLKKSQGDDARLLRKYATRQTSDLRFTVVDGENDIQIELVD